MSTVRQQYAMISMPYGDKFIMPTDIAGKFIELLGHMESVKSEYNSTTRAYEYTIVPISNDMTIKMLSPTAYDLIKGQILTDEESINAMSGKGS